MSTVRAAAVITATALALSSCAGPKPLVIPGDASDSVTGRTCLKAQPGNPAISIPIHGLKSIGESAVTITDVELVDAKQMALVGAEIAQWPSDEANKVPNTVVGGPFPPDERDPELVWRNGLTATDAVLDPGTTWTLSVGVKPEGPVSVLKWITVKYVDADGNDYVSNTAEAFMVRADCFVDHDWPAGYD